jgi:hypothetical protein
MMISCPWLAVLILVSLYVESAFLYAKMNLSVPPEILQFFIGRTFFLVKGNFTKKPKFPLQPPGSRGLQERYWRF